MIRPPRSAPSSTAISRGLIEA